VLNGAAANDTFNLGNPTNQLAGLQGQICIAGGGNAAAPTVTQTVTCNGTTVTNTLPSGDVVNFNDQGSTTANTYNLSATALTASSMPGTVTYTSLQTVNLNAGTQNNTINVASTADSANTNISANGGSNTIAVTTTGTSSNVVINGGAGADTYTVANTGGGSVLLVNGTNAGDTLTVTTTGANSGLQFNGGSAANTVNFQGSGAGSVSVLNGGAGNDTFNVGSAANSLATVSGLACFNGGGNNPAPTVTQTVTGLGKAAGSDAVTQQTVSNTLAQGDALNVNDQGSNAVTYTLSATDLTSSNMPGHVVYQAVQTTNINAAAGNNTITVNSTPDSTNTNINNANATNDSITLSSTGVNSNVVVTAGSGADNVQVNNTGAGSVLIATGGAGANAMTVANTGAGSGVHLLGGAGSAAFTVTGTATGSVTALTGGAGSDTTTIQALAGSSLHNQILGLVTASATAGVNNVLNINDSADKVGRNGIQSRPPSGLGQKMVFISALPNRTTQAQVNAAFLVPGATISYSDSQWATTAISLGSGNDTFNINGTSLNGHEILNAGNGKNFTGVSETDERTDLTSGTGNDTFAMGVDRHGNGATLGSAVVNKKKVFGTINGGKGQNLLSFSTYTNHGNGVTVNLSSAASDSSFLLPNGMVVSATPATAMAKIKGTNTVVAKLKNLEDLVGSTNTDVLIGGQGAHHKIDGHGGNDIIIGGYNSNQLVGGTDGDPTIFAGPHSTNAVLYAFTNNDIRGALANPAGYVAPNTDPSAAAMLLGGPNGTTTFVVDSCTELRLGRVVITTGPLTSTTNLVDTVTTFAGGALPFNSPRLAPIKQVNVAAPANPPDPPGNGPAIGQNLTTLAFQLLTSKENRINVVQGYYQQYLGQSPDSASRTHAVQALAAGTTRESVLAGILGSPDYFAAHGNDNSQFIAALYHDLLGRLATPIEIQTGLALLGHFSRSQVALGILTSTENRTELVNQWSLLFLGHPADATTRNTALAAWKHNATQEQIQASLLAGDAYQHRVETQFGGPGASFLLGLARDVLGRSASQAELQSWLAVLEGM
jgi:hypothetical protein